ncbi:LapD/MoxY N-terminal periplasmic domain-containing protein [Methylomonas sp. OY6]|uniref:LapD/MoxY N-terminal periplasmic domain-containing protein n=1 Tax=Methylomonas defluvii TaxID=3045149 RepID=A0ABU4UMN5_9GAMM|nr:LapD/MoxY N-terminal periplasmic domain-containing protein [Methylomonas sp. OY6]MDX8130107.1 LapD/MoxY N-terminal periplasmic domain-containing protein [Methylomonas sp. OY6]
MSLSKQLLILISALFLMIFSVNFALSVNNIKDYLEGESKNHAQDTATSLGLSLSPYMVDNRDPVIKTMMSAIFDMGYYKEIRLVDADNKELVALSSDKRIEGVPDWFTELLPMTSATAESEISSGWNMSGVIYVTVNSGYAYLKLYEQAKSGFYYSLAAFLLSIALLALLLRVTLASLSRIDLLAQQISDGHFESIEALPWTREVRNVAASMNTMSHKIKTTIAALHGKLDQMGASLLRDDLTGLYKKSVFETDMKNLALEDADAFVVLIKIDSLVDLVKERDSDVIDQFLQAFAAILGKIADLAGAQAGKAYRFYGAEFALVLKLGNAEQLEGLMKTLSNEVTELGERYQKTDLAHIGVVAFNPLLTTEILLEAAHEAYEQAHLIGTNSYFIRTGDNFARDIATWKDLVFDCVDNDGYSVWYIGQIAAFSSGELLMEEAFIQVHDKQGGLVAIGPFISIAEKFAKIVDLDKGVIRIALEHIRHNHIEHAIAVNVSTRTIKNSDFRLWLEKLIKQNPAEAKKLVFSLSAYAVVKDIDAYQAFIETVHAWGARVMIKRFETQSMSAELVKRLKPDFIRLARDIGNGIDSSSQKHAFVQTMQEISTLLDISILAENVQSDQDYRRLKAIGIVGASR